MRVFYIFSSLRGLAMGLFSPVWILFLADEGYNYLLIGVIGTVFEVARLVFEVPSGTFADRYGVKLSITGSLLFSTFTWAFFAATENMIMLIAVMVSWALSESLISGAFETWMSRITGPDRFGKELMKNTQILIVFIVLASIASGYLYKLNPMLLFLLIAFIYFILFFWTMLFIKMPYAKRKLESVQQESFISILQRSFSIIITKRRVMLIVIAGFFSALTYDAIGRYWQPFLNNQGISEVLLGYVMAIAGLCALILLTITVKAERFINKNAMTSLAIVDVGGIVLILLLSIGLKPLGVIVTSLLLSIEDIRDPIVHSFLNKFFPDNYKATLFSLNSGVGAAGEIFSGIIFGVIAVKFGLTVTFLLAAICLIPAVIIYILVPKMKVRTQINSQKFKKSIE
ncbi:MFS transporter [Heyndrickxia coagulans]|uniref:MFS transporter n=1 Tax=Heyndrickxia coagulans TaxID=1398 RepID=UPI0006286B72|nr:MFS transporter [Heyndrickxia coagulans]